jgi:alanine racemase
VTTSNPASTARIWADIDLSAVLSNARTVADASGARLLPMVKAGAYGLGAVPIARTLERLGPWGYGVATLEEGVELRMAGITRPVVVFTPLQAGAHQHYLDHDLRPVIGELETLREWVGRSHRPFHVEIDTGMARAGFRWNDVATLVAVAGILGPVEGWEGLCTHFHSADENFRSLDDQWERFEQVIRALPKRPPLLHAANSGAALRDRRFAGDMVRPGIFLYGGEAGGRYPSPVVRLHARVVALREVGPGDTVSYGATWTASEPATIASLSCGYADGIPRALSGRGKVELNGQVVTMAGRVTMDMTMVALPAGSPVRIGDVATIFGGRVTLDQQAAAAETISYELLTNLGRRVERYYHEDTDPE